MRRAGAAFARSRACAALSPPFGVPALRDAAPSGTTPHVHRCSPGVTLPRCVSPARLRQHGCIDRNAARGAATRSAAHSEAKTLDESRSPATGGSEHSACEVDAAPTFEQLCGVLPEPGPLQQTLRRSFTVAGVGLHSGETEVVRVGPAYADEGRYFVRVLPATLPTHGRGVSGVAPPDAGEVDAALLRLLKRTALPPAESEAAAAPPDAPSSSTVESPPIGTRREQRIRASRASLAADASQLRTMLRCSRAASPSVSTVEHLLAALEACGVDNARVEAQGSGEMPILDGSAALWVEAIAQAGVTAARGRRGGPPRPRRALQLSRPLAVGDGDAFVAYVPGPVARLTVGIDFAAHAPVIGRQWFTWCPATDAHFYSAVAPARTFTTRGLLAEARCAGLVRGGSLECALVADGHAWVNPPQRVAAEPCRHKLLDLVGDLALAAAPGHAGVPLGHVTAYKAGHALHARFVAALVDAAASEGDGAWVAPPLHKRD